MKRIVAIAVLVLALAVAAVALGAVPKKGVYSGETSQSTQKAPKLVSIKINKHHNIPDGGFSIDWSANKCEHGASWDDSSESDGTIDVAGDGSFKRSGHYNHTVKGYKAHIKISAKGKFNTKTSATGTFNVKVRVTRNGDTVDHCHANITWSVSD